MADDVLDPVIDIPEEEVITVPEPINFEHNQSFEGGGVSGDFPAPAWTIQSMQDAYKKGELSKKAASEIYLRVKLQGNIYDMDEESVDLAHNWGMINDSQLGNWKMRDKMPFWFQVADFGRGAGKAIEDELESNVNAGIELVNLVLPDDSGIGSVDVDIVDEPETLSAGIFKSGMQFAIPFVGASKLIKGSKILAKLGKSNVIVDAAAKYPKLVPFLKESGRFMAAGAVADYVGFDAFEGRLSDFMADRDMLPEYLTFMRTNPNNPAPLERLKTALEGMGLGLAIDALLLSIRGIKTVMHQRYNYRTDEIAKKIKDKHPDMMDTPDGYIPKDEAPKSHKVEGNIIGDATEGVGMGQKKIVDPPASKPTKKPMSQTSIGRIFSKTQKGLEPEFTDNFLGKIEEADGAVNLFGQIMDEAPYVKTTQTWDMTEAMGRKDISKKAAKYGGQPKLIAKAILAEMDSISFKDLTVKFKAFDMFTIKYGKEIHQLCKDVAENGSPKDIMRAKEHLVVVSELQDRIYGIRSESGRLLNSNRMARKEARFNMTDLRLEENVDNIDNWRKVVAKVADSNHVDEVLEQARYLHKGGWMNFGLTYSQTSKLWGIRTHLTNIVSQTAALLVKLTARAIGTGIHALLTRDVRHLKAYKAEMTGIGAGWNAAMKGMKKLAPAYREAKEIDVPFSTVVRENPDIGNFWKASIGRKPILDGASKIDVQEAALKARLGKLGTVGDTMMKVPFHALVGVDEAFKNVASYSDYFGRIVNEGIDLGHHGKDLDKYLKKEVKNGRPDLLKESLGAGREVTYQKDLGKDARKFLHLLNNTKIGLGVRMHFIPFYSIAINLAKYPIRNSFLGVLSKSFKADLAAGGVRMWESIAKMAFGSGMGYWGWTLHDQGRLTGTVPAELRETYRAANRLEHSLKTDSGKSISLLRGAPFSLWLLVGANLHAAWDAYQDYKNDPALDKEFTEVYSALVSIPMDYVIGNTWMSGAKDFMEIITDPDKLASKGQKIIGRQLEGMFPLGTGNLYDWIRHEFGEDNYLYELNTIVDAFRNKVSTFMKTEGIIRRDALYGEQIKREKSIGRLVRKATPTDPAATELLRVKYPLTPFREYVRHSGISVNITPKQVDEIEEIYSTLTHNNKPDGLSLKQTLNKIIEDPKYKALKTDEHKRELLGSKIATFRRGAVLRFIDKHQIVKDTIKQKKELKYLGESIVGSSSYTPVPADIKAWAEAEVVE